MRGTAAEQKTETIHVAASAEWAGNGGRRGGHAGACCLSSGPVLIVHPHALTTFTGMGNF